jgi:diguanylate cyclase (GGDEF)-like protein
MRLQDRVDKEYDMDLAIAVFDCNTLKEVNDKYGHEKGDIYLRNACQFVCKVFDHSPVFRTGGDEFIVFLMNEDFKNREKLFHTFDHKQRETNLAAENKWDEIDIAYGVAVFDPDIDDYLTDTVNRADKSMYDNKAKSKAKPKSGE